MYIKLTRRDNSPIWLNAAFIVTIEPDKPGGSIVVPVGDGLDYGVKESPEEVLAMLAEAPAATVVPVPASDALVKKPEDVSDEPRVTSVADQESVAEEPKTRKRAARKPKAAKAKPTAKATKAPAAEVPAPAVEAATDVFAAVVPAHEKDVAFTGEQIERIRKLAPKSMKKLANTLTSQFKVGDVSEAVKALTESGAIRMDGERIVWL